MPEMTRRQALTTLSAAGIAVTTATRRTPQPIPAARSVLALDALASDLLLLPPAGSAWFGAYPGPGNADPNGGPNPYEGSSMANRQLNCWYRYYAFTSGNIPSVDDETLCAAGRYLVMSLASSFTAPAAAGPLTKVAAGSNGVSVSQFTGSGVLQAKTTGYPTSGTLAVVRTGGAVVTITYTGVTGSAFTGCTTTAGSGTLATGNQMGIAYSYAAVTAGAYDAAMTTIASRAKSMLPNAWFLAFQPEPDISARLGYGTASQYVSAFQHVVNLFRAICGQGTGAGNVVTMWDISTPGATAAAFYPGDAYADWICVDPYDPSLKKGSPEATYTPVITWLNTDPLSATGGAGSGGGHGKPLGINETGVDNTVPDASEAAWIQAVPACLAPLRTTWGSQVRLWQWFNSGGTLGDTAITPGSGSAAALAQIGASSFFNQRPVYLVTSATSFTSVTSDVLAGLTPTRPGDTIVVPIMGPYGLATVAAVSDSRGNVYKQAGTTDAQFDTSVWVATQGPGGGSNPTAALTASDSITVKYSNGTGDAGRNIVVAAVASVAPGTIAAVTTTDGKSAAPSAAAGTPATAPAAVLAFESNQVGGGAIAWTGALAGTQLAGGLTVHDNPESALAGLVAESTASVTASGTISATEKWSMTTIILPLG